MDIEELTVDQILLISELVDVAKKAKEAEEIIRKAYAHAFGIGVTEIEVWHDRDFNNFEYLSHDGVWKIRYLNFSCDVSISASELYKYFRAEYMDQHGYKSARDTMKEIQVVRYLYGFLSIARSLVKEEEK